MFRFSYRERKAIQKELERAFLDALERPEALGRTDPLGRAKRKSFTVWANSFVRLLGLDIALLNEEPEIRRRLPHLDLRPRRRGRPPAGERNSNPGPCGGAVLGDRPARQGRAGCLGDQKRVRRRLGLEAAEDAKPKSRFKRLAAAPNRAKRPVFHAAKQPLKPPERPQKPLSRLV